MQKFRLVSDLHLELNPNKNYMLPVMDNEKDQILLLAGDVLNFADEESHKRSNKFLLNLSKRFSKIIAIPGNHEYFGSSIESVNKTLKATEDVMPNFKFLNSSFIKIDDILIIGCTLWTDFGQGDLVFKSVYNTRMKDCDYIRIDSTNKYINADYIESKNLKDIFYIKHMCYENKEMKK